MGTLNSPAIVMADVDAKRPIEAPPTTQMCEDAVTEPDGRRFLLLALAHSRCPTQHHASLQIEPEPLQRDQHIRPTTGIEPEQYEACEVRRSSSRPQQSSRFTAGKPAFSR